MPAESALLISSSSAQFASGAQSFTVGYGNTAEAFGAVAMGSLNTASGSFSVATGSRLSTRATLCKRAHSASRFAVDGGQQKASTLSVP